MRESSGQKSSRSASVVSADERVRPEDAEVARDAEHRLAERVLGAVAEHQRQHERRQRVVELLQDVADDAEDDHQPDVEHGVVNRVGADRADDDDHRRDDRERDAQDRREERHRREHDDEARDVAEVHRGDETPDEVLLLDEEQRPRLEPPDHEAAQQHRRGGRARDAEREHRQERAGAGGVRRGLRRDHALDAARCRSSRCRARSASRGRSP